MQKQFQQCEDRYACVSDDESINLLFRIYDDYMEEKGICIAKIGREAVNVLLGEGIDYSDCTWMVLFGDDRIIAFQGRWSEIEQLTEFESVWRGKRLLKEHNVIGCAKMCGFDIRTVICVGEENIFSVLKSTVLIFVVGLIIVLIVTVLVAFGLSYRFTRPVTRMIEKYRLLESRISMIVWRILRSRSIMTLESCSTRWLKGLNI
ncbi:cell wall metabolism sensor histidine kinase WalK [Blautia sp. RD014234]|nr:cell wall metabolism sensor histidine kinase WalK [Blautia parvula]